MIISPFVSAHEWFWEVNGTKGGKVYILGSLDIGSKELYPLSKEVNEAFDRSNYLILQEGKGPSNEAFIYDEMYVKARLEDNDTLANHITSETYASLRTWLKQQKLPISAMDRFPPWVAGLTLSSLDMALWGEEKRLSLENHFYQKARRESKGIYSLERLSEVFLRFKELDDVFQESLLLSFMAKRVNSEAMAKERFTNYQEGNATSLERFLLEPVAKYPIIKERILDDKNRVYANKIKLYRNNKRGRHYFLIINLEHLLGADGVLAQLEEAGVVVKAYEASVTPVP